jgi:sporulation integral membrane protein YlbJ
MALGIFGAAAFLCFILMIFFPQGALEGARTGLSLWADILTPSLLPFFILSEILIRAGWLNRLGKLLSPLTTSLFRLPGDAGFVILMGYTTGFPMGAVLTRRLYEEGRLTRQEAAVLTAFTNNASPLFILAALAAGMLREPALGGWIALCHYGANLLYGICLTRFSRFRRDKSGAFADVCYSAVSRAVPSHNHFSAGLMIAESIRAGVQNMIQLGGYIVFFASVIQLLNHTHILSVMAACLNFVLPAPLASLGISRGILSGALEMTSGLSVIAAASLPRPIQARLILELLGFSGLSVQAQVSGMLSGSGIPLGPYFLGRLLQPLLSIALFQIISPLIQSNAFL